MDAKRRSVIKNDPKKFLLQTLHQITINLIAMQLEHTTYYVLSHAS